MQCRPTAHSPVNVVKTRLTQLWVGQITCAMFTNSAKSSFHRKITYTTMLSWSAWPYIAREIDCAMLTHSPQTTLHKKIIYYFVWIYLSQCCTRKLLVQCWPICLTMFMRKITCKCYIDPSETTLHKRTTCTVLAQSAQDKWLVACFLTRYNILNNLGSPCSMLAWEFIYGFQVNNEQEPTTETSSQATFSKKNFLK